MREFKFWARKGKTPVEVFNRDNDKDDTLCSAGSFLRTEVTQHLLVKKEDGEEEWSSPKRYLVSTTFLPVDHSFGDSDEPVLFETMVFGCGKQFKDVDFTDLYCKRFTDYDEAVTHHLHLVGEINAGRQTFEERTEL